ncbi:MAG TPA: ATP-binding protein, partial [Longimicrobiaceae bacterium]|nr:ATP-binding protein [Longimicrobiaceae bacterium]
TAVAAVLLESKLGATDAAASFARGFAAREGLFPVFVSPDRAQGATVWDWAVDQPILSVTFGTLTQLAWWHRVVGRGRWAVGLLWAAGLALLIFGWYRHRVHPPGAPVALTTLALLLAPIGEMLGAEDLFSPMQFVLPLPWDVTLGMLLVLLVGIAVWVLTRTPRDGPLRVAVPWWAPAVLFAVYVPGCILLFRRSASAGLLGQAPAGGFALQLALTLLLALPLFLLWRHARVGRRNSISRSALIGAASLTTIVLAILFTLLWNPARPPSAAWAALWAIPVALFGLAPPGDPARRAGLRAWLVAGGFAAVVAMSHLWVLHVEAKLHAADRELARLGTETDPFLDFLLRQFAERATRYSRTGEDGVNLLYHTWVASGLAREGYEARLTIWDRGAQEADLQLAGAGPLPGAVREAVAAVDSVPVVEHFTGVEGLHYLLTFRLPDGRAVSVAVPPRTQVGAATALARFLQPDVGPAANPAVEALYLVPMMNPARDTLLIPPVSGPRAGVRWIRTATGWRSETRAHFPAGWMHAHLYVRTAPLALLLGRGVLAGVRLLLAFALLWAVARLVCRDLRLFPGVRTGWVRSFRGRLTLALFVFFLLPTATFGLVAYSAVSREVTRSAEAVALRALRQTVPSLPERPLPRIGADLDIDLLLYSHGSLMNAAAPEVLGLGLFQQWLPAPIYLELLSGEYLEDAQARRLGSNDYLVAYRRLDSSVVLAAPIPLASEEIARRQTEFRDMALLVSLLGAALSIVLALLVGRALTRPIDRLSRAAALVGAGDLHVRLPEEQPDEFGGVYQSFNRMVGQVRRARTALVRETRRTEAIVEEAATGVLAFDSLGRLELANPRALEILGGSVAVGRPLPSSTPLLDGVARAFTGFWHGQDTEVATELEVDGRIVRLRMRRLRPSGSSRGAVVSLEDVTAEIRSARVLAWGEMARQIAHEIKNPLTPIKLAVQHLRRAFRDGRPDYDQILERNVESVLQEIDRLSEIARAFSRFGAPQAPAAEPGCVDVVAAVDETLALYRGAGRGIRYRAELEDAVGVRVYARPDELKEVLVNLLENAREAIRDEGGEIVVSARRAGPDRAEIVVADTGEGIPPELLTRVFEPQFSTRSSGTGLGLAIVRRLVESWGGEVSAEARRGGGTRVRIHLRTAEEC